MDDVMSMKPGRELDAKVAEALGWTVSTVALNGYDVWEDEYAIGFPPGEEIIPNVSIPYEIENYSTKPTAMMKCWEWLNSLGYELNIRTYPKNDLLRSRAGKCELWASHLDALTLSDEDWVKAYQDRKCPPAGAYATGDTMAHALALIVVKVGRQLKNLGVTPQ